MVTAYQEAAFETLIEAHLLDHGWLNGDKAGFDRKLAVHPGEFFAFLEETQPEALKKLASIAGGEEQAREDLLKRLAQELDARGTLDLLRRGFKDRGVGFQLAYFKPAHGMTPDLVKRYKANRCSVVRQLVYASETADELDLALFVNGLLVATAELKNPLTGQGVEDAKHQYRYDRSPKDKALVARALVHFAVDPDLVFLTTRLAGADTTFLPFNRGAENGGAGNPPHTSGHATSYLWEGVWQRDAWLELLQRFLHFEKASGSLNAKTLLFPRFHQWQAVCRLRDDAQQNGTGHFRLIQHSAGSGKSNTIGWLAHQLANVHAGDEKVFDKVIVITDRRVLDQQLQDTVFQFDHTPGVVVPIEKHSGQLAAALKSPGAQIIITTLQKFPFVLDEVKDLPERRYAVIVDEAHSSQTGETAKHLKAALGARGARTSEENVLASAESLDESLASQLDPEEFLAREVEDRGRQPNLSFFAFTATPKQKTLELFGQRNREGDLEAFHVYTMRQAIEEKFILDVLLNYTTYKTYWKLAQKAAEDPKVDRAKAARALARYVSLHPYNLAQKAEVIIEHFRRSTRHKIGGKAKAMVVTRSRLHAVRYKEAVDRYLKDKGYEDIHTLVAFSGKVIDEHNLEYTESQMNDGLPEARLPETFESDAYQLLIVAEKYQTGYDQPLLHTMYVDKKLEGVKAVQTLSRLNRRCPGKDDTFILDFANDAEAIQAAFAPFFETTIAEPTDLNLVYQGQNEVESYGVISGGDVDAFVSVFAEQTDDVVAHPALYKHLEPARKRFLTDLDENRQEDFRSALRSFVRLYAFLAQVVPLGDSDLEKLYLYGRFLLLRLPHDRERGLDISESVELTHLRTEMEATQSISLTSGDGKLTGFTGELPVADAQSAPLSEIVKTLNERFGTDFTTSDHVYFEQLVEATVEDDELAIQARVNSLDNWKYAFNRKFEGILVDRREANEDLFRRFIDDPQFAATVSDWVMREAYERSRGGEQDTDE